MCAAAYVLMLRELHRQIAVRTQAVLLAQAMGDDGEIPDPSELRQRFEELLRSTPVDQAALPVDRTTVLREAFGLSGG